MNDRELLAMLRACDAPPPREAAAQECLRAVKNARLPCRRYSSLARLMRVQLGYIRFGRLAAVFAAAVVCFAAAAAGGGIRQDLARFILGLSVGVTPLFLAPLAAAAYRSRRHGMLELEAACRYSLQRLTAARLLACGAAALLAAACVWLAAGLAADDYAVNRLLFSITSYNICLLCVVLPRRRAAALGAAAAAAWSLFAGWVMLTDELREAVFMTDWAVSALAAAITAALAARGAYRYIKTISFETEVSRWSSSSTD